jgi:hypothetical protein
VTTLAALMSLPAGSVASSWTLVPCPHDPGDRGRAVPGAVVHGTVIDGLFSADSVRRAGFTSQLNYLIPLWAVGVGVLFLGEQPTLAHLGGLGLILGGILLSRREPRSKAVLSGNRQRSVEQVSEGLGEALVGVPAVLVHHLVDDPAVLLLAAHQLLDLEAQVAQEGVGRPRRRRAENRRTPPSAR